MVHTFFEATRMNIDISHEELILSMEYFNKGLSVQQTPGKA